MRKGDTKSVAGLRGGKKSIPDNWLIAVQLLDTGWRVALPIILLTYLGMRLDRYWNTTPSFVLIGLFLSLATAVTLVYRQIHRAYPDFFSPLKKDKDK